MTRHQESAMSPEESAQLDQEAIDLERVAKELGIDPVKDPPTYWDAFMALSAFVIVIACIWMSTALFTFNGSLQ